MTLGEFRTFTEDFGDDVEMWIVTEPATGGHVGLGDLSYEQHTTNGNNLMLEPRRK